jgi:hypothetical protein
MQEAGKESKNGSSPCGLDKVVNLLALRPFEDLFHELVAGQVQSGPAEALRDPQFERVEVGDKYRAVEVSHVTKVLKEKQPRRACSEDQDVAKPVTGA